MNFFEYNDQKKEFFDESKDIKTLSVLAQVFVQDGQLLGLGEQHDVVSLYIHQIRSDDGHVSDRNKKCQILRYLLHLLWMMKK